MNCNSSLRYSYFKDKLEVLHIFGMTAAVFVPIHINYVRNVKKIVQA